MIIYDWVLYNLTIYTKMCTKIDAVISGSRFKVKDDHHYSDSKLFFLATSLSIDF